MKKSLTLILLGIMILGFANNARVNVLGPWWAVRDANNVFNSPSFIMFFPEMVSMEGMESLAGATFGGGHFKLSDTLHYGLYLHRTYGNTLTQIWNEPGADTAGIYAGYMQPTNFFDFILGMDMGAMKLGFLFNFAGFWENSNENALTLPDKIADDYEIIEERSVKEFNFTFDISLIDFAMFQLANFAIDFGLPSVNDVWEEKIYTDPDTSLERYSTEGDGMTYLGFRSLFETKTSVFYLGFTLNNLGHKSELYAEDVESDGTWEYLDTETTEQSIMNITAGFSKKKVWKKLTLRVGAYFNWETHKWETLDMIDGTGVAEFITEGYNWNESVMKFPAFISGEFAIKKWLTLRAGMGADMFYVYKESIEDLEYDPTDGSTTFSYTEDVSSGYIYNAFAYLGVQFFFHDISLDFSLLAPLMTNTYLITGMAMPSPIANFSISYYWGRK